MPEAPGRVQSRGRKQQTEHGHERSRGRAAGNGGSGEWGRQREEDKESTIKSGLSEVECLKRKNEKPTSWAEFRVREEVRRETGGAWKSACALLS